jgi:hypothetical protein
MYVMLLLLLYSFIQAVNNTRWHTVNYYTRHGVAAATAFSSPELEARGIARDLA